MYNSENLQEKWQPVLKHPDLPEIKDNYKKGCYFSYLGKPRKAMKEDAAFLREAAPLTLLVVVLIITTQF